MFQALEAFRGQLKGLAVAINFVAGGKQFVMVTPVVADEVKTKNPELAQPFSFTASAAELDAEFAKALGTLAAKRESVADQAKAQAEALKAKPATALKKPGTPSKSIDIDDEGSDSGDATIDNAPVAEPKAAAAPAALTAENLFGNE